MIGQTKIINELKSHTLETLNHNILLVGPSGCGKHTLAKELSAYFHIPLIDITKDLSYDLIANIQLQSTPSFYLIDLNGMSERNQNVILKFIEEPDLNSYVILVTNSCTGIIETVLNRCLTYNFESYTRDELKQFIVEGESETLLDYCFTPGQIERSHTNINNILKLGDLMVTKFKWARFDNALSISEKINYKDNYDKFDIDLFFTVVMSKLSEDYIKNKTQDSFLMYNIMREYYSRLRDTRINREILVENMLVTMWRRLRYGV